MLKNFKIIFIGFIFLAVPFLVQATEGEFNVDPSYDYLGRSKVSAFLYQIGVSAYFYIEDDYYRKMDIEKIKIFSDALQNLSQEFDTNIYPKLTNTFGSEWKPGIDNDPKITVLITQIKGDAGGYFNSGDEYSILQSPNSNQREMVYLNANYITSPLAKVFLAHEFTHLIGFNQKDKIRGITEEIWLNEMRSESAPRILGYDDDYENSNLAKRLRSFLQKPQDSLTEWKNESPDYGVINLFMQYLVDHYGIKILSDSLSSNKIGIASLNLNFSQVFTDWTIAVLVNDCALGPRFCYLSPNLKNFRISSQLNFLPSIGESSLSVVNYVKNWAGNWYKFIGGQGTLKLEFIGDEKTNFKVPYLLEDNSGNFTLDYLKLDNSQRATQFFSDFGKKYRSLTIIPSLQTKISGFDGIENYSKFIFTASILGENQPVNPEEELIKNLLAQIAVLKEKIAQLLASSSCSRLTNNLYFGMRNNQEVRCLQEFLKIQVTGNYFSLTMSAVKKYQASRGIIQTGFFGPLTRAAVNQEIR
ncbi:MAG: peptidoglycan-binding domain-containing protein [Candidatus Beckwithbacteria bacterium]